MKKLFVVMTLALALIMNVAAVQPVKAADGWSVDFDVTFNSKYVWRGMLLVDDWVAQPSVNVSKGGFTFNAWADFNLTDQNNLEGDFDEIDLTLDYTFGIGDFSIPVGVIAYTFPNGGSSTTELYVGLAYDWIISPSITVYQDVDEIHGTYILGALDFSYDFPAINDVVSVSFAAGASLGWGSSDYADGYFGVDESHMTDWSCYASLPITITEYVCLTPTITYTGLVDSEIKDAGKIAYSEDSNTYFGVSVTLSF